MKTKNIIIEASCLEEINDTLSRIISDGHTVISVCYDGGSSPCKAIVVYEPKEQTSAIRSIIYYVIAAILVLLMIRFVLIPVMVYYSDNPRQASYASSVDPQADGKSLTNII